MLSHVLLNKIRFCIHIAVSAQVTVCIVSADVCSEKALAFAVPLILAFLRHGEVAVKRGLIILHCHASRTVCTIRRKVRSFRTRSYSHAVIACDLNERFADRHLIRIQFSSL